MKRESNLIERIADPDNLRLAFWKAKNMHHALMNVCHPNFEQYQIYHSYASRIGKGTYAALEQACVYQKQYDWFLKLDVRKYFDSIDHDILKHLLSKRFKDKTLLNIFDKIIDNYNSSFSISDSLTKNVVFQINKGLPIGNLTSQYFANHYLSVADHYAKEKLHIPAYVRYMDDVVMCQPLFAFSSHADTYNLRKKMLVS